MTNEETAIILRRIADLMELYDEGFFKLRSYRNAAEVIEDLPTPLTEIIAVGGVSRLRELPSVGDAISNKIIEIIETGTCKLYEQLKADIPETVLDLLKVEGVGIKTAQILFRQFKITNLEDFARFARGGGLQSVPRLGEKTQARIAASLFSLVQ